MRSHPLNQDNPMMVMKRSIRADSVCQRAGAACGAVAGLRVEPGADKLSSSELLRCV